MSTRFLSELQFLRKGLGAEAELYVGHKTYLAARLLAELSNGRRGNTYQALEARCLFAMSLRQPAFYTRSSLYRASIPSEAVMTGGLVCAGTGGGVWIHAGYECAALSRGHGDGQRKLDENVHGIRSRWWDIVVHAMAVVLVLEGPRRETRRTELGGLEKRDLPASSFAGIWSTRPAWPAWPPPTLAIKRTSPNPL